MDNSNNKVVETIEIGEADVYDENKRDEIVEKHHQKGLLDEDGLMTESGEFIPRAKQAPRMGLTQVQEYDIARWVKQMIRDFPEIDPALADLIATHCYMHPEEAEAFVKERLENPPDKKDHEKYFEGLGLERVEHN
jgi:hypothetical protein